MQYTDLSMSIYTAVYHIHCYVSFQYIYICIYICIYLYYLYNYLHQSTYYTYTYTHTYTYTYLYIMFMFVLSMAVSSYHHAVMHSFRPDLDRFAGTLRNVLSKVHVDTASSGVGEGGKVRRQKAQFWWPPTRHGGSEIYIVFFSKMASQIFAIFYNLCFKHIMKWCEYGEKPDPQQFQHGIFVQKLVDLRPIHGR